MKTDLKVLFYLKKNQADQSGLSPVMGRITVGRTMAQFSLKLKVDTALWDTSQGRMRGKSHLALGVNRQIDKTHLAILARYKEIKEMQGDDVTATGVKNLLQGMAKAQDMVLDRFRKMNDTFSLRVGIDRSVSGFVHYQSSYRVLQHFLRQKYNLTDISFKALTYSFIEDYHFHLRVEKKYKPATVKGHILFLHKVVREAVKQGIINSDPFHGFKPERISSVHKALTKEELEKIMSLDLPGVSLQTISRDMFIFACFTGMAYTDVKHLKADKTVTMEDGSKWIITQRQKTGTPFSVRLMDIPLSIIDKYKGMATGGELFPMPKAGRVYYYLNLIARSCGMNKTLSFHMGRHTFASLITLSEGLPIETLCKMLGHKNIKTTQIYAELSLDKIAQEIQRLAERIRGKYLLVD